MYVYIEREDGDDLFVCFLRNTQRCVPRSRFSMVYFVVSVPIPPMLWREVDFAPVLPPSQEAEREEMVQGCHKTVVFLV